MVQFKKNKRTLAKKKSIHAKIIFQLLENLPFITITMIKISERKEKLSILSSIQNNTFLFFIFSPIYIR